MKLDRRDFLAGAAVFGAASLWGVPTSGRRARIGLVTDTHIGTIMARCARIRERLVELGVLA